MNERELRRRINNALGLLQSQGRAVGVTVVGAIQDPRKEVLPDRDLFPVRAALRLTEADQVRLILSAGARDRGAKADLIPHSLPGVGFVIPIPPACGNASCRRWDTCLCRCSRLGSSIERLIGGRSTMVARLSRTRWRPWSSSSTRPSVMG